MAEQSQTTLPGVTNGEEPGNGFALGAKDFELGGDGETAVGLQQVGAHRTERKIGPTLGQCPCGSDRFHELICPNTDLGGQLRQCGCFGEHVGACATEVRHVSKRNSGRSGDMMRLSRELLVQRLIADDVPAIFTKPGDHEVDVLLRP